MPPLPTASPTEQPGAQELDLLAPPPRPGPAAPVRGKGRPDGDVPLPLVHAVARRGTRLARRGVRALRSSPGTGPANLRRNSAFWATLARVQLLADGQTYVRHPRSATFVRASIRLSATVLNAQSQDGLALATGTGNWLELRQGAAMDPALDVCRAALDVGLPEVALDLAQQIADIRPRSRAAWKVLADAYEALGRRQEAERAARQHARLCGIDPGDGAADAVPVEEVVADLRAHGGPAPEEPVPTLFRLLQEVQAQETGEPHRPGVHRELVAAALAVQPPTSPAVVDGVADLVLHSALVHGHDPDLDLPGLARKTVASRPRPVVARVSAETARSLATIDAPGLRRYLDGRSICLVANSQRVGSSGAGEVIDGYDVVARFNSFRIDPRHTGSRTSIHAAIHLHDFNWSVPVDVRLVFSGNHEAWRESINKYVDPGAQTAIGDASLRWPVRRDNLVGDTTGVDVPTSGFNLLRLVDFLDVSTAIDLIGFDFNTSGAYRLDSAMHLPVARAHDYTAERAWVMAHATRVDDLTISLR